MLLKSALSFQNSILLSNKIMSNTEIVQAFMSHLETCPMSNDFQVYWSGIWKPITQRCLNVAKHEFVMQKAFEIFQANKTRHDYSSSHSSWSEIFVCKEEEEILKSLCRHVKLQEEEFLDYGLNHHRNRCRKYYTKECQQ
mgnify:FL=1